MEPERELALYGGVSSNDYPELFKLIAERVLSSAEVGKDVEAGYLVGFLISREDAALLGPAFIEKHPYVVLNPGYTSNGGFIEGRTGRKMLTLSIWITSIAPPIARAHVDVEKGVALAGNLTVNYAAIQTRAGWTLPASAEQATSYIEYPPAGPAK